MVYTVYIDVLFTLDFIIDYLILYAVGEICGAPIFRVKLIISAAIGATFSILSLFWGGISAFPLMSGAAYLMVGVSFGFKKWKHLLVFLGVSSAFGGMVFTVNYIIDKNLEISLKTLAISSVVSYFILFFAFRKSASGTTKKEYVKVDIEHGGSSISVICLVDSGNSLVDAMTNTPVLIAELSALKKLFDKNEYEMLSGCTVDKIILNGEGRYRPVPYKTVGGGGLLPAFYPDEISCKGKKRHLLVAVTNDRIGENCSGIIGVEEE